jgi:hypothetical protein
MSIQKLLIALIFIFMFSGCSDKEAIEKAFEKGKKEGYDEGYKIGHDEGKEEGLAENEGSGHEEGYTEGYDIGYQEGYNIAIEETESFPAGGYLPGNTTTSLPDADQYPVVGDLTLHSDGIDWNIALELDKRQFIQELADANGEFITYSDAKQIVAMIDAYYESNLKIKTIQEALEDLK